MKKYFVLTPLFLCFVVGLRAQLNEIYTSYHTIKTEELGRGVSVSYFRNISSRTALGIRTNYRGMRDQYLSSIHSGSLDLVNRWNMSKNKKFRFLAEFGASVLRRYERSEIFYLCGNISPTESYLPIHSYDGKSWMKNTYFGLVGSLGFDVSIGKYMVAGMDCSTSYYYSETVSTYNQSLSPTNIRLKVGTRF
jgi:hypothetical protein